MYVHEHAKAYITRWKSTHWTPCLIFVTVCGQQHFQHSNDNSSILLDRMYLEGILNHQWGKFSLCCLINIATLSCQLKMTCLPNILEVASFGDRGAMHWCPITKCQNLFLMPHLAKTSDHLMGQNKRLLWQSATLLSPFVPWICAKAMMGWLLCWCLVAPCHWFLSEW